MNCNEQDNPYLVDAVKRSFMIEPYFENKYNFDVPLDKLKLKWQSELPQDVDDLIFKNKLQNGFFIEAGATNGESGSNTLFFELERNWTGLLVEPLPYNLAEKNRKAHISQYAFQPRHPQRLSILISMHSKTATTNPYP